MKIKMVILLSLFVGMAAYAGGSDIGNSGIDLPDPMDSGLAQIAMVSPLVLSNAGCAESLDLVNVRAFPNMNAEVVGQMLAGEQGIVKNRTADGVWLHLQVNQFPPREGWVRVVRPEGGFVLDSCRSK